MCRGQRHVSMLGLTPALDARLILADSLTKTFNLPGVILSWLIVPDATKRRRIEREVRRLGMNNPTIYAAGVVPVALREAGDWYETVLEVIDENEAFTRSFFAKHLPELRIHPREACYLLWIDYAALGCEAAALERWLLEEARVELYMGASFGPEGDGYLRLNLAAPQSVLAEAYGRMQAAWGRVPRG